MTFSCICLYLQQANTGGYELTGSDYGGGGSWGELGKAINFEIASKEAAIKRMYLQKQIKKT